ncbi:hypothetical protein Tco_0082645, partial [Tanacetum coccineum]
MSSASSAVTYTSVYTDSEPGRVFWGADEEISDGGPPRVIVYGYDGLPMQPVDPPSPDKCLIERIKRTKVSKISQNRQRNGKDKAMSEKIKAGSARYKK